MALHKYAYYYYYYWYYKFDSRRLSARPSVCALDRVWQFTLLSLLSNSIIMCYHRTSVHWEVNRHTVQRSGSMSVKLRLVSGWGPKNRLLVPTYGPAVQYGQRIYMYCTWIINSNSYEAEKWKEAVVETGRKRLHGLKLYNKIWTITLPLFRSKLDINMHGARRCLFYMY